MKISFVMFLYYHSLWAFLVLDKLGHGPGWPLRTLHFFSCVGLEGAKECLLFSFMTGTDYSLYLENRYVLSDGPNDPSHTLF